MRIAVLEDDIDQAALLDAWLRAAGHSVTHCAQAEEFLRTVERDSFDLYMLDWMLPLSSGMSVLKLLRARDAQGPPVLFITARDEQTCVVEALEAGADDYMVKPVTRAETLARVTALGRRHLGAANRTVDAAPYSLDLQQHLLTMHGEPVELTDKEFALASFLFQRVGQIVSRTHLLESVWGIGHSAMKTRTVDTHISRLRQKLRFGDDSGWTLSSIYQHGYRLDETGRQQAQG